MVISEGDTDGWLYKFFTVACKIQISYFSFDSQSWHFEF